MEETEIVRRCAFAVAVATGVDPYLFKGQRKGDAQLQFARKLWVQMVCVELDVGVRESARLCGRTHYAVMDDLAEVEEWRGDDGVDQSLDGVGDALRALIRHAFAFKDAAPDKNQRYRMRAVAMGA